MTCAGTRRRDSSITPAASVYRQKFAYGDNATVRASHEHQMTGRQLPRLRSAVRGNIIFAVIHSYLLLNYKDRCQAALRLLELGKNTAGWNFRESNTGSPGAI